MAQDQRLIEAHDRAVASALVELEQFAATRVHEAGQITDRLLQASTASTVRLRRRLFCGRSIRASFGLAPTFTLSDWFCAATGHSGAVSDGFDASLFNSANCHKLK